MHRLSFLALLAVVLLLSACSSGGSDAPLDNSAHPAAWFLTHSDDVVADPGYTDCVSCHGADLSGSGKAVSCYSCHSYDASPEFTFHPASWTDTSSDHRAYAAANGFASCASCHGQDLRGRQTVPSCFSASFSGMGCHADGPSNVPHELDGSYRAGIGENGHGQDAKADLTACQSCHGELGGPGSNPRFNIGITNPDGSGCESTLCHDAGYAHPQNWAGPNSTFHYTADNVDNACTLCHGEALDGVGGVNGGGPDASCLGCHDSVVDFGLDCTFCHGYPPDGSSNAVTDSGVEHFGVASGALHLECKVCHGVNESSVGGSFSPASRYLLFDYATETNGDHWDGNLNISAETNYDVDQFGCDNASCHGIEPDYQMSDSGLSVVLKFFFGND